MRDKRFVDFKEPESGAEAGASELKGVVGWIPCSERMPPPIVLNESGEVGETYAVIKVNRHGVRFKDAAEWHPDTGFDYWWLQDPRPDYTITHWCPLPEYPPNKDSHD